MTFAVSEWNFWNTLALLLLVVPLTLVAALALIDTFRRPDLTRLQQAVWVVVIVLIPLVGSVCYLLMRPEAMRPADLPIADEQPADDKRAAAATRAEQLQMLSRLHDAGKLTDSEFAAAKIRVLRENGVAIDR